MLYVWILTSIVVGFGFYSYDKSLGREPTPDWSDNLIFAVFIFTYIRAKWILRKIESN